MTHVNQQVHIDRDYARLLMAMRKQIREEFQVKIQISESDSTEKLLHYAATSQQRTLQEMGKELNSLLHPEPEEQETSTHDKPVGNVRYYRGVAQTVDTASTNKSNAREASATTSTNRGKVIYRGRVVSG